jgi:hypothetical protein
MRPSMAPQILRACIAGRYVDLFKRILSEVQPDYAVLADANIAGGLFDDDIEKRVAELDGKVIRINWHEIWKRGSVKGLQVVSNKLSDYTSRAVSSDFDGLYEGYECNAAGIEVFGSLPEDWKSFPSGPLLKLDYDDWP